MWKFSFIVLKLTVSSSAFSGFKIYGKRVKATRTYAGTASTVGKCLSGLVRGKHIILVYRKEIMMKQLFLAMLLEVLYVRLRRN